MTGPTTMKELRTMGKGDLKLHLKMLLEQYEEVVGQHVLLQKEKGRVECEIETTIDVLAES